MANHKLKNAFRALTDKLPFGRGEAHHEWLAPDRGQAEPGREPAEAERLAEADVLTDSVVEAILVETVSAETVVIEEIVVDAPTSTQAPDTDEQQVAGADEPQVDEPPAAAVVQQGGDTLVDGQPVGEPSAAAAQAEEDLQPAGQAAQDSPAEVQEPVAAEVPGGQVSVEESAPEPAAAPKPAAPEPPAAPKPAAKKTAPRKTVPRKTVPRKTAAKKSAPATSQADPEAAPAKTAARRRTAAKKAATTVLPVREGEEPWTGEEIAALRGELVEERSRLAQEIADADAQLAEMLRDAGDGGEDQADAGSRTLDREQEISLAANASNTLEQVDRALRLLDEGGYGVCEHCGQPIGKVRLQAFPRATMCLTCKEQQERR